MAVLRAIEIDVRFGGLQALSSAEVLVRPGMVTGLIGPNGAGKTTLFNVITGLQPPTRGQVVIEEDDGSVTDLTDKAVHKRSRSGIARTFQKLEAFNTLSARDNVLVAAEMRRRWDRSGASPRQEADEILERVGISEVADITVGTLPTGTARLVELARALASRPRFLLLDEPSSGLNEEETHDMGTLLRRLVGDGLAVLLVEHDMSFVMGLCEHIHVLDFGRIIATGSPAEVQQNKQVQAAYLGSAA
ncbi:MAG: ABC transporter ATP-binding protein [Acidimicrobiales bacterium]|nr:ABC transporter ATP-binding protein [Acidimicrobiales bacterium]